MARIQLIRDMVQCRADVNTVIKSEGSIEGGRKFHQLLKNGSDARNHLLVSDLKSVIMPECFSIEYSGSKPLFENTGILRS